MIDAIRRCLRRDLDGFLAELDGYPDDASVWAMPVGVANSTGTLALHVAGNLRHFIGASLGGTGYVRDREAEFATRDLPRTVLVEGIRAAQHDVDQALAGLEGADLAALPPVRFGQDREMPVPLALAHLATHLAYHLGQADIHRRIVTGERRPVGALGVKELTE